MHDVREDVLGGGIVSYGAAACTVYGRCGCGRGRSVAYNCERRCVNDVSLWLWRVGPRSTRQSPTDVLRQLVVGIKLVRRYVRFVDTDQR